MTTLAGAKMRRFREAQQPRLTREAFGERYGLPGATVLGLEDGGKRPRSADVVNALAADGIAEHADWFVPARCPTCDRATDEVPVAACRARDCPLAVRRVA